MNPRLTGTVLLSAPAAACGNTVRKRLRKPDKLRFRSEFEQVRNEGVKQVGQAMLVVIAPAPDEMVRCGVICGKKYSLLAVKRNRARRLLWESFRLLKPYLFPCHLVLIPRKRLSGWKRRQTTRELAELLARSRILPPEIAASPPES